MSSYEGSSLTEIEAVLDGLEEATSAEVYDATRGYSPKALAAVAASRADAAGGGGASFPDEWTVGSDGSLQITPSDEPGDATLRVDGVGDSGNALFLTIPEDSSGSLIQANVGAATAFLADFDGSVTVGRQLKIGGGDPWFANADGLQVWSGDGERLVFQIRGGGAVQVYDSTEALAFKIDTDGSVHIKTGTTIQADL